MFINMALLLLRSVVMITRKVRYRTQGRITVCQIPVGEPPTSETYSYVLWPKSSFDSWMSRVKAQIETRRDTIGPHTVTVDGRQMRTGYAQSIKADAKPDVIFDENNHTKKFRGAPYPPPDGAIVMNPYEKSRVTVTQVPGQEDTLTKPLSGVNTCIESLGLRYDAYVKLPNENFTRCFLDSRHFVVGSTGFVMIMDFEEITSHWTMPWEVGAVQPAKDLREQIFNELKMDSSLVQSAQAEANEKFLDLTTELAELPETVKMVLQGFRKVGEMVRDFKSKKFSLTKASVKRRAYLKKKFDEDMASLNLKRKGASKKMLHILDRAKKRAKSTYTKAVAESLRELADAISNLWLQFRYGIMPIVYTVESVQDLVKSLKSEYITARDKESDEIVIKNFIELESELTLPVTHRVTIKQRYKPKATTFEDVLVRVSGNFALTLWELVPLSFVVDWFVNVGDLLSSLNPSAEWDEEQQCYAWRITHTQRLTLSNKSVVIIDTDMYKREIIPDDVVSGLRFDPNLNLYRLFDAVALLWGPIKSTLITSKKR